MRGYTKLLKKDSFALIAVFTMLFSATNARETTRFDNDWRFINSDINNASSVKFDDSAWESVRVPHDWAIDKNFDMSIDLQKVIVREDGEQKARMRTGRTGSLPHIGVGWYRKNFDIAESAKK